MMKGYAVTLELPVLWGDMDALRHVNNARFFSWFEAARIAYFERLRSVMPDAGRTIGTGEVGPVLASTSCDYLRPVSYPGVVLVGVRIAEVGNSSLRMEYAVARADATELLCAQGKSVTVLVRYASMEKVPVPDAMRAAIEAMEQKAAS